jgi:RNA polymerase sigma-70 factor (ECF subfamily)
MEPAPHPITNQTDDGSLWKRFLSGDKVAYARIYQLYVQDLYVHGARYTPDKELLKDVIQDIFVRLYQRRERLRETDNIKLYLLVTLKHDLFNLFARQRATVSLHHVENTPVAGELSPEEEEEYRSRRGARLLEILDTLPARQREVIRLRFTEELSYEEISALMEMNYQSVHNLLQRALKKIRKTWGGSE